MRYSQVNISYTVAAGSSGNYDEYRVNDVLFIRSDSDYLKRDDGANELAKLLTESSTRGGGIGRAHFDDIELTIHAPREFRAYPHHHERGGHYYLSSIDAEAENVAHAVHLYEIKNRDVERNVEALELARRDLERQINITAGLNRRYTSYDKLRNERRKIERVEKRERILMAQDRPMREISQSQEWKKLQKRKQQAQNKLEHMQANKARYVTTLNALRDELKTIKEAQREVEREQKREAQLLEQRFNELKRKQQNAGILYRQGEGRSPLLDKSDEDLRKMVQEQRQRELNPEQAAEKDRQKWAEQEKADIERARELVKNSVNNRHRHRGM